VPAPVNLFGYRGADPLDDLPAARRYALAMAVTAPVTVALIPSHHRDYDDVAREVGIALLPEVAFNRAVSEYDQAVVLQGREHIGHTYKTGG